MTPPRLAIFDCDGVIVDSEPVTNALLRDDLATRGLDLDLDEIHRLFVGGTMDGVGRKAREMGADIGEDWVAGFYAKMFARLAEGVPLIDGVVDLIDRLEAGGTQIWVASNGPYRKMETTLGPHGLWERFAGRILSREDHAPKPAPDMILYAMRVSGHGPGETVFIDDSATGCRAGIAAGVRTIGYAETSPAAALRAAGAEPMPTMADVARALGV